MSNIKAFWWQAKNFGDTLTPFIIEHFTGRKCQYVPREASNKLLCVGSILHCIKPNDIILGTGLNRDTKIKAPKGAKFISVRGPLTRERIVGAEVPENYGDPALVLPLIYNPVIARTHKVGYLPHYVDKALIPKLKTGEKYIDIQADWKTVIKEVKSCDLIIASSLHGIICAEAYGIPAIWAKYSDKIVGGPLKYQDYFLGTGRDLQKQGEVLAPIPNLLEIQNRIIASILESIKLYDAQNK
jgi:pyruvyltransferase